MKTLIDWSLFDNVAEDICHCRCGAIYSSHAKIVNTTEGLILFSQKPCPKCGKTENHLCRVCSPPELETIC